MNQNDLDREKNTGGEVQNPAPQRNAVPIPAGFARGVPVLLLALSVFLTLCFVTQGTGAIGRFISSFLLGLFSYAAYALPILIAIHGVFYYSDLHLKRRLSRLIFSAVAVVGISALIYVIKYWGQDLPFTFAKYYTDGKNGAGLIGSTVAFLLMKVIGPVGVIILTVAVFALYFVYFFSRGKNAFTILGLKILTAILSFFSIIERKIVGLKKKSNTAKENKKNKAMSRIGSELSEDDYFAVDNGLQELSIPELDIHEVKSRRSLEENPTLHDRVYPKQKANAESAFRTAEAAASEAAKMDSGLRAPDKQENAETIIYDTPFRDRKEAHAQEAQKATFASQAADDSAEAVFTKDFDPFNIALNTALATKKSSRAAEVESTGFCTEEDALPSTPEEAEKRLRAIEFEKKKQQIIEERQRAEQERQRRFEAARQTATESAPAQAPKTATEAVAASAPEMPSVSYTAEAMAQAQRKTVELHEQAPVSFGGGAPRVEDELRTRLEKPTVQREAAPESAPYQSTYGQTAYSAPSAEASTHATEFIFNATAAESEPKQASQEFRFDPPAAAAEDAPRVTQFSTAQPIQASAESTPSFRPFPVTEPETGAPSTTEALRLERETLSFSSVETPEEELDNETEIAPIPPEEQNPQVLEYRNRFTFLREEEKETIYAEQTTDPSEIEEDEDDEDAPPFDDATDVSAAFNSFRQREVAPEPALITKEMRPDYSDYKLPSLELLTKSVEEVDEGILSEIQERQEKLIDALASFNVVASIKSVERGPRVTRYEVVPAKGIKSNAITNLFDDICMALEAKGVRMESIPERGAIGFEIPNRKSQTVRLRDLIESEEFLTKESKTSVCIGKDVTGNPVFGDIAKMPHVLVAGATGMGKSVCINAILVSMLYKARPDEVKFILVDPKKVEFNVYNGIPHLLIPVVTDPKQAAGALMWAVEQMEKRYDMIEKLCVRNIEAYNQKVKEDPSLGEPMPKIVIVIDELNDLMIQVRDPVENLIMSIAQKARAAGIHLIIGTQRPSVNVITGVIKANIPSRISCKVSAAVDSRTILERVGAEKLLNNGDMLFHPVSLQDPIRVQGAFVADGEVEAVMAFLKKQAKGHSYDEQAIEDINRAAKKCSKKKDNDFDGRDDDDDGENEGILSDPKFLEAVEIAIKNQKIATSLLQRKLAIGYSKAASYIDAMEGFSIVGGANGSKPREVLMSYDEWQEMLARRSLD